MDLLDPKSEPYGPKKVLRVKVLMDLNPPKITHFYSILWLKVDLLADLGWCVASPAPPWLRARWSWIECNTNQTLQPDLQSWPKSLGHLAFPTPLIKVGISQHMWRCLLVAVTEIQHWKVGVEGRGDGWLKRVKLCASVPTIFVQDCRFTLLLGATWHCYSYIRTSYSWHWP